MARNVNPTATMCAWYQVVATWAVNQKTVPKAKKIVGREPHRQAHGQPSDRPPADRDIDGRQDREDDLVVRREAPDRDERQQRDGGERRERSRARAIPSLVAIGSTSWKNALPGRPPAAATG